MATPVESPTLLQLKKDLLVCFRECSDKGLIHASNWWDPKFLVFFPVFIYLHTTLRILYMYIGLSSLPTVLLRRSYQLYQKSTALPCFLRNVSATTWANPCSTYENLGVPPTLSVTANATKLSFSAATVFTW